MKNKSTAWWIVGIIIVIGGLFAWSAALQKSDPTTVASNGIHWHPQLHIFVDGEEQSIPENIGLVGGHKPIHTHTEDAKDGVLHLEFEGRVEQDDLRLQSFFDVWSKDMDAFGTLVRMTVNEEENTEYGEYVMGAEDVINLYYESAPALDTGDTLL